MATPINTPLPDVSPGGLSGLLEILAARGGRDGLAEIADDLSFEIDDLLPLTDAAVMLTLARIDGSDIEITGDGKEFAAADILTSKQLFARHAAKYAPLVRTITQALAATADHTLRIGFFIDILRRGFSLERGAQPARHGHRLGPLRRALRLRQRRRGAHPRTRRPGIPLIHATPARHDSPPDAGRASEVVRHDRHGLSSRLTRWFLAHPQTSRMART